MLCENKLRKIALTSLVSLVWTFGSAAERSGEAPPESAVASASEEAAGEGLADAETLERFRAAGRVLESSTDIHQILRATKTLQEGLPGSRPALHEQVERGSKHAKMLALRILGESGEASEDMDVAAAALKSPEVKVRLAAVMAIRRLGAVGYKYIADYLPGEVDPNNRKMAVRTLQGYGNDEAVPLLVQLLEKEKDRGARNFMVKALEVLADEDYGNDVEAWKAHVEKMKLLDQAHELLDKEQGKLLRDTTTKESEQ